MGIIVDFGKKGFVRLRNSTSTKEFDLERKLDHLLYNDRFQTGIDERGLKYRFDPRHYMHTITMDHVARQDERIAELEQRCETLQKAYEAKEFGNRILTSRLNVSASQADTLKKQKTKLQRPSRPYDERSKITTTLVAVDNKTSHNQSSTVKMWPLASET